MTGPRALQALRTISAPGNSLWFVGVNALNLFVNLPDRVKWELHERDLGIEPSE
jgi:hypothetical protein